MLRVLKHTIFLSMVLLGPINNVIAHGGPGHINAVAACEDKKSRDHCVFKNAAEDIFRGHCLTISEQLRCVRNKPIERSGKTVKMKDHDHIH